jgi:hypothetical protein
LGLVPGGPQQQQAAAPEPAPAPPSMPGALPPSLLNSPPLPINPMDLRSGSLSTALENMTAAVASVLASKGSNTTAASLPSSPSKGAAAVPPPSTASSVYGIRKDGASTVADGEEGEDSVDGEPREALRPLSPGASGRLDSQALQVALSKSSVPGAVLANPNPGLGSGSVYKREIDELLANPSRATLDALLRKTSGVPEPPESKTATTTPTRRLHDYPNNSQQQQQPQQSPSVPSVPYYGNGGGDAFSGPASVYTRTDTPPRSHYHTHSGHTGHTALPSVNHEQQQELEPDHPQYQQQQHRRQETNAAIAAALTPPSLHTTPLASAVGSALILHPQLQSALTLGHAALRCVHDSLQAAGPAFLAAIDGHVGGRHRSLQSNGGPLTPAQAANNANGASHAASDVLRAMQANAPALGVLRSSAARLAAGPVRVHILAACDAADGACLRLSKQIAEACTGSAAAQMTADTVATSGPSILANQHANPQLLRAVEEARQDALAAVEVSMERLHTTLTAAERRANVAAAANAALNAANATSNTTPNTTTSTHGEAATTAGHKGSAGPSRSTSPIPFSALKGSRAASTAAAAAIAGGPPPSHASQINSLAVSQAPSHSQTPLRSRSVTIESHLDRNHESLVAAAAATFGGAAGSTTKDAVTRRSVALGLDAEAEAALVAAPTDDEETLALISILPKELQSAYSLLNSQLSLLLLVAPPDLSIESTSNNPRLITAAAGAARERNDKSLLLRSVLAMLKKEAKDLAYGREQQQHHNDEGILHTGRALTLAPARVNGIVDAVTVCQSEIASISIRSHSANDAGDAAVPLIDYVPAGCGECGD